MIDLIARAAGKFLWDAIEKASNKHDYNSQSPMRRNVYFDDGDEEG